MNAESPSLSHDLLLGARGRCPHCGKGRLFAKWLKVAEKCDVCGEEFHHHRADDFPAYVVILLVGHIVVPLALEIERIFTPAMWVHMVTIMPFTVALCLGLLQPVKGAIVALQWRMGMHGFRQSYLRRTGLQDE